MGKQIKCDHCKENAMIIEQGQFYSCATCWLKVNAKKSIKGEKKQ